MDKESKSKSIYQEFLLLHDTFVTKEDLSYYTLVRFLKQKKRRVYLSDAILNKFRNNKKKKSRGVFALYTKSIKYLHLMFYFLFLSILHGK